MTMASGADRDALIRQIVKAAMERTGARKGAVYILEPQTSQHYLRCQEGFGSEDYVHYKLKCDGPVAKALQAAGKVVVMNGPEDAPSLADYLAESGADSMLLSPVAIRGVLLGLLDLRDKDKGKWKDADAAAAAEAAQKLASVAESIPAIKEQLPAVAAEAAEPAAPAPAEPSQEPGPDDRTWPLGTRREPTDAVHAVPRREDAGFSTAVMRTLKEERIAPPPSAPTPAAGSLAREERRRRPLTLPIELLRDAMPALFRMLPIDYVLVGLCEEGIMACYYVGVAPVTDARRKEMVEAARAVLLKAPFPGPGTEFVADEMVVLEAAATPIEAPISAVIPYAVPLPRMGSEARTTLVLAAIQIDRVGFGADSLDMMAQYGATLKNLFFQRLRTLDYRQGYLSLLNQLLKPLEKTLPFMKHHSIAVANYAKQMALKLGLDEMQIENIMVASILHDVGLLDIDFEILKARGALSEKDLHEIRKHPIFSRDYVEQVTFPYPVAPLVYSHHERWDGKGYPEGLRGEAIPLGARIIAIAEAFDAMSSRHSYKAAMPPAAAVEELRKNAGTQFDPRLVETFLRILQRGPKK